ncbi:MAG: FkbM family methyltransferase [Eubacterium sp.]|nr:FkbM family methyltransferase [Eubacterium sp.]
MLEHLSEKENIWNYLARSDKPIVVYGMGNGAQKIIDTLEGYGGKVSDIFASDDFVRGHSFLGFKVMKYAEICEKYDDFIVVLGFATHIDSVLERIKEINRQHPVFAPDVPVAGGGLFTIDYVKENEEKFDFVYNHLADEESKRVYLDIINFKISGKIDYLFNTFCDKSSIYYDVLKLTANETIVDLGAYDGDTIREFTNFTNGSYNHIYALEPDAKNYKKLLRNTEDMKNITSYNMGAWNKKDTLIFEKNAGRNSKLSSKGVPVDVTDIDSLINDDITMIKMDIEGAELHALDGAKNIIQKYSPKLYVCAYHRNEDLFALPMKILCINNNYQIYFRHSPYIPAWECNFYCITD